MLIRVQDLEIRRLDFAEELQPGVIDYGRDLQQCGGLKSRGHAELIREHRGAREYVSDIRLVGDLAGRFESSCARCLQPVPQEVSRSFDLLYRPLGVDRGKEEVSINQAETEIGYYEGEGLELEDVLREQVLLAVPIKTVCRADCKGLCPECGYDLNQGNCNCQSKQADPRWYALRDLKSRLH